MLDFLSIFRIMLSYIALFLYLFIFAYAFFISFIAFKKRKTNLKKFKNTKTVCFEYTGTCVLLDGH